MASTFGGPVLWMRVHEMGISPPPWNHGRCSFSCDSSDALLCELYHPTTLPRSVPRRLGEQASWCWFVSVLKEHMSRTEPVPAQGVFPCKLH